MVAYIQRVVQRFRAIPKQIRGLDSRLQIGIVVVACLALIAGVYALGNQPQARPSGTTTANTSTSTRTPDSKASGSAGQQPGKPSSSTTTQTSQQNSTKPTTTQPASTPGTTNGPRMPASILDLTNWKLTLPIGQPGNPDEISQPTLANYSLSPYFQVDAGNDGVEFEAPANGVTTSGSDFPRSELREMTDNGQKEASWSTTTGTSTMTVREAIDHLPSARPQVVAAQVHGSSDYVILIRLNGSDLFVEGDGKDLGDLDTNYTLGTIFNIQITASNGHILVSYNGTQKVDYTNSTSGDYFKAGCYTQSNPSYGDGASSYGQTTIYSLSVSHT